MRERELVAEARGWGQSVTRIQQMPTPQPRNVEPTMAAIPRHPAQVDPDR
jgi:dihydroorotase